MDEEETRHLYERQNKTLYLKLYPVLRRSGNRFSKYGIQKGSNVHNPGFHPGVIYVVRSPTLKGLNIKNPTCQLNNEMAGTISFSNIYGIETRKEEDVG